MNSSSSEQLWKTDGTASGTAEVASLPENSSDLTAAGQLLFFTANNDYGNELWSVQPSAKVTPVVSWANPAAIVYGTALGAAQLDATSSVPGTFIYTPAAGTILQAGAGQTLTAAFTPSDTADYTTATVSATIDVTKATPKITWANPASIASGTAVGAAQLDATSNVPGTFSYSPSAGTVLHAGSDQSLTATFTPTDTTDYTTATAKTTINVVTTPVAPAIIGEHAVFTRRNNKHGKAVGKPVLAGYAIDFSTALNASSATNSANYQVYSVSTKRAKRQVEQILLPIDFTVSYDATSDSVSVMLVGKQNFKTGGQISVLGGSSRGIAGTRGGCSPETRCSLSRRGERA